MIPFKYISLEDLEEVFENLSIYLGLEGEY